MTKETGGKTGDRIKVNGEERPMQHGKLGPLLEEIGYTAESKGVAVAVNHEVVPRARWDDFPIAPGDSIEIVSAVQGG